MKRTRALKGVTVVIGARQHNLKNIDVTIPHGSLTVVTGPSGSGKSSLVFDTIFAEGQRRYVESLSVQARQFLAQMQKPDVDQIEGLRPTIAIEQRATSAGPRSTVATATDLYDFLRVLFARVGTPHCWVCDRPIVRHTTAQIVDDILTAQPGRRFMILAPLVHRRKGNHAALLSRLVREGFIRARIDGQITMLEEVEALAPHASHTIDVVVDRLTVKPDAAARLAEGVELAQRSSRGRVVIAWANEHDGWDDRSYSAVLSCPDHPDVRIEELSPPLFSFNTPRGACPKCHGMGTTSDFDPELVVPDRNLSLSQGAIAAWRHLGPRLSAQYAELLRAFCKTFRASDSVPFRNIPEEARRILMKGTTEQDRQRFGAEFEGVLPNLKRRWEDRTAESVKHRLLSFMADAPCDACGGSRLCREARSVRIGAQTIAEVTAMTVDRALRYVEGLGFEGESETVAEPLLGGIKDRLRFLVEVGVDYLTLDRPSTTLSGGEWQRIRLGTQIGSGLSGVCYVLDEPTIGLHARDSDRLLKILKRLSAMDNTVILVEHDLHVIAGATHMIDLGPGAGPEGGHVLAQGTLEEVRRSPLSLTARFLNGTSRISRPEECRPVNRSRAVTLYGVTARNLKNLTVRFPLGCFVCVTGVSGSGKSTLVSHVLLRALRRRIHQGGPRPGAHERISGATLVDRVIEVDQSPIGKSTRSNPATYVGALPLIRELFATTRESKIRGYTAARFSFNVKGGRCEHCMGLGQKQIAMHFLPDVFVTCSQCGGRRFNRETLEVRYRGKTIADVLDLSVADAHSFFHAIPKVRAKLTTLKDVGLGYLTLGQPANTLSGGEAQRVKLAAELSRSGEGHTLYVLDEPTTGLHLSDIRNLLSVLGRLVDRGQTVLVIEHHLDVIKFADWVIDLGPEGGDAGGSIVAEGTPEEVAACDQSHTGRFLRGVF